MAKIAANGASVVPGETNVTKLPGVSVCRGGRGRSVTLTSMSVPQIHLYAAPTKYARISRGPTHVLAGMVSNWWIINAKVGFYFELGVDNFLAILYLSIYVLIMSKYIHNTQWNHFYTCM